MSKSKETFYVDNATEPEWGICLGPGNLTNVHNESDCTGDHCVIHNPSDHHMREWPLSWRGDKGAMERTCPHGIGHPDPDDAAHWRRMGMEWKSVHGCCGCCHS